MRNRVARRERGMAPVKRWARTLCGGLQAGSIVCVLKRQTCRLAMFDAASRNRQVPIFSARPMEAFLGCLSKCLPCVQPVEAAKGTLMASSTAEHKARAGSPTRNNPSPSTAAKAVVVGVASGGKSIECDDKRGTAAANGIPPAVDSKHPNGRGDAAARAAGKARTAIASASATVVGQVAGVLSGRGSEGAAKRQQRQHWQAANGMHASVAESKGPSRLAGGRRQQFSASPGSLHATAHESPQSAYSPQGLYPWQPSPYRMQDGTWKPAPALDVRPQWDGTPMRARPAALTGLKPVTREPWAEDEHVYDRLYEQKARAVASRPAYVGKPPERYLDKTARKLGQAAKSLAYKNRFHDKYVSEGRGMLTQD